MRLRRLVQFGSGAGPSLSAGGRIDMNELTTGTAHQFLKRFQFGGARLRAFRVRNTAGAATAEVRLTVRAADTGRPVRLRLTFAWVEEFRFQRRPGPGLVK